MSDLLALKSGASGSVSDQSSNNVETKKDANRCCEGFAKSQTEKQEKSNDCFELIFLKQSS